MKDIWIKIFKAGKHKDSTVPDQEFTIEFLHKVAETYNNQPINERHDAPLILGDHKEFDENSNTYKPSMGWVRKLRVDGDILKAQVQPAPELIDHVRSNRYKKVSAAFREHLLKHVAILGGVSPAVKGLGMLNFEADDQKKISEYQFTYHDQNDNNDTMNFSTNEDSSNMNQEALKLRDFIHNALKETSSDQVAGKFPKLFEEAAAKYPGAFANGSGPAGDDKDKDNNPEKKFEETEAYKEQAERIRKLEADIQRKEFAEFIRDNDTKITPAMKDKAVKMLEMASATDRAKTHEFSEEGDAKSWVDFTKGFLSSLPAVVEFSETAPRENHKDYDKELDEFAEKYNKRG